jgi:hypothetical protein
MDKNADKNWVVEKVQKRLRQFLRIPILGIRVNCRLCTITICVSGHNPDKSVSGPDTTKVKVFIALTMPTDCHVVPYPDKSGFETPRNDRQRVVFYKIVGSPAGIPTYSSAKAEIYFNNRFITKNNGYPSARV